jgi:ribosomal protein L7/L12
MDDATLTRRLAAIEDQLDRLSREAGVPYERPASSSRFAEGPAALPPEVEQLVLEGNKIAAIALLRRLQGLSLVEAKTAVDSFG